MERLNLQETKTIEEVIPELNSIADTPSNIRTMSADDWSREQIKLFKKVLKNRKKSTSCIYDFFKLCIIGYMYYGDTAMVKFNSDKLKRIKKYILSDEFAKEFLEF